MTTYTQGKLILKEEELMQKTTNANTEKEAVGHLTMTLESGKDGTKFYFIRLDGELIKVFVEEDQEGAQSFFDHYRGPGEEPKLICERFLNRDGDIISAPVPRAATVSAPILTTYRGWTIKEQPYNGTPWTLEYKGAVIPHQDEESLREIFDSIDQALIDEELENADANIEPMPAWRKNDLEIIAKLRKEKERFNIEYK